MSSTDFRQQVVQNADRVVVKVGTRVLTHDNGTLNEDRIADLAEQLCEIEDSGRHVILVSSGAVGAGMSQLNLTQRPSDLANLQAVAAVGQTRLIETYDRTLRRHGRHAAQVLLTINDLNDRTRYLNVRNTLASLLRYRAIPVINENDTVAVDELMAAFGDNDHLAAVITTLLQAPLLVILSDVDGLYDGDPHDSRAQRVALVESIDARVMEWVRDRQTGLSRGGMASKLAAARLATTAGDHVIVANGHQPGMLRRVFAGEDVGTLFVAHPKTISSRKRWIGFSATPEGDLTIDAGAQRAVVEQGRSLLPIGIVATRGQFGKGDVIRLLDTNGREIARGLTNYDHHDVERIQGLRSDRIRQVLGHHPYDEVVHRDNLAVLRHRTHETGADFSG